METQGIQAVFRALNTADVRYLVADGLAVVAHGFLRATQDIDLVLALDHENTRRAIEALQTLGYKPTVPVPIDAFTDAGTREKWARDKDAKVFQLFSDKNPTVRVDLFLEEPFDFDEAFERAKWESIDPNLEIPFVSLEDLIAMKQAAGRPQDLEDVEKLQTIRDHSDES